MEGGNSPHLGWGSLHREAEGGRAKGWKLTKMATNGRTSCHQCGSQGGVNPPKKVARRMRTLIKECCLTYMLRGAQYGGVNPLPWHPTHLVLSLRSSLAFSSSACAR